MSSIPSGEFNLKRETDPDVKEVSVSAAHLAIATLLEENARLKEALATDGLTGLPNRQGLDDAFRLLQMGNGKGSIGVFDLDRFKEVNDGFDHSVGDEVLERSAERVTSHLRESDIVGRWGGDEFVVLLPNTDIAGATLVGEKVCAAIKDLPGPGEEKLPEGFGATFAIAEVPEGASFNAAFMLADTLLVDAKERELRGGVILPPVSAQ